jgi:hypothetical protein|tara:strand:- start:1764 stop:2075 length:312 start_codon:yes stop_codon:yes gene_type:complete
MDPRRVWLLFFALLKRINVGEVHVTDTRKVATKGLLGTQGDNRDTSSVCSGGAVYAIMGVVTRLYPCPTEQVMAELDTDGFHLNAVRISGICVGYNDDPNNHI